MFSGGINENTEFLEVIVWNFFYWTNSSNIIDKYIVITFFIANNPSMPSIHAYNWKLFFKVYNYVLLGSCPEIPC